jgi:membrane protein YdbS with pleckstrin-like domain
VSDDTFSNERIEGSTIPSASNLQFEALAPTYARTMIIEWLVTWVVIASIHLALAFFVSKIPIGFKYWFVTVPFLLVSLSVFLWAPAVAKSRGYAMREKDIHYKSGIIWQKTISLPFNRIQHVELESGPLERIFKLTTLKFFTAGGGAADMKIPALTFATASKIRAFVVEKAGVDETTDDGNGSA